MKDYTPKLFDRANPCTKVDIHNCFYEGGRYVNRPVIEAKTVIGENTPKYLIREELVVVRMVRGVDTYCITPKGDQWIRHGILRYLSLHPEKAALCNELPVGFIRPVKRARAGGKTPPRKLLRRRLPATA